MYLSNPNSLFIAVLANQLEKTTRSRMSSMRTTTARAGTSAILSSGERTIEKINIINAASVLMKGRISTIGARIKIRGRIGKDDLETLKNIIKASSNKEIKTAGIVCPFFLDMYLSS